MSQKTILIADDDATLVHVVSKRCEAYGLNVKRAYGVLNALSMVQADAPDLVCCDVNMPDGNGLAACEILATSRDWSQIPRIVLTARQDAGTIQRCRDLGAHYLVKSESIWPRLEPLIQRLLEAGPAAFDMKNVSSSASPAHDVPTLVVIDDDIAAVHAIDEIVAPLGFVVAHSDGLLHRTQRPSAVAGVFCEFRLNSLPGPLVVSELRGRGYQGPIIMMGHDISQRIVIESLSAGTTGFLAKPFTAEKLIETLRRHTGLVANQRARVHAFA